MVWLATVLGYKRADGGGLAGVESELYHGQLADDYKRVLEAAPVCKTVLQRRKGQGNREFMKCGDG